MSVTLIVIIVLVVLVLGFIMSYNGLVALRNQVDNAFASIDVELKRRFDMIPNIVAVVKQYAAHEADTLEKIVKLRAGNFGSLSNEEKVELDRQMQQFQRSINVVVERYPDLKANQNFLQLQNTLEDTENKLSVARRIYNGTVTEYNTRIQTIPTIFYAGMFGFTKRSLLETAEAERQNVNVANLFKQ